MQTITTIVSTSPNRSSRFTELMPLMTWLGADVLRRHQPGIVAQCLKRQRRRRLPCRSGKRQYIGEPRFHLATRPFLPQYDGAARIVADNMERVLADIDADSLGCLRHGVLLVFGAPCQLRLLVGQEHGRTIPLTDLHFQLRWRRPREAQKTDKAPELVIVRHADLARH